MGEMQMVIAVRRDLKLPKGKLAVQAAHAAVDLALKARGSDHFDAWRRAGQKKVAVFVEAEADLYALKQEASDAGLFTALVRDAGRTVLEPGTVACLAIGPAPADVLEPLTGDLKLV